MLSPHQKVPSNHSEGRQCEPPQTTSPSVSRLLSSLKRIPKAWGTLPLILHRCDQQLRKQPLAWPRQKSRRDHLPTLLGGEGFQNKWEVEEPSLL